MHLLQAFAYIWSVLQIADVSAQTITPFPQVDVLEGHNVNLVCKIRKYTEIDWYLEDRLVLSVNRKTCDIKINRSEDENHQIDFEVECPDDLIVRLIIKNVTTRQHGERWSCDKNFFSVPTKIYVIVPVQFVLIMPSDVISLPEKVRPRLTCLAPNSRPAATIRWYKDNRTPENTADDIELLHTDVSVEKNKEDIHNSTSRLLLMASRTDKGMRIYCTANNTNTSIVISEGKPLLDVLYPPGDSPTIQGFVSGKAYKMIANSTAVQRLTCFIADGSPLPTLIWTCYNGESSPNTTETLAYNTITWIGGNQERTCTCNANHPLLANALTVSVKVEIIYPPQSPNFEVSTTIIESPGYIEITEGESLTVTCRGFGHPISYVWSLPEGTMLQGQQLNISNIRMSTTNLLLYTCIAYYRVVTGIGKASVESPSSRLLVVILHSPRPARGDTLVTDFKAALHSQVKLKFTTLAYPVPEASNFVWQRCNESMCKVLEMDHDLNISTIGLVTILTFNTIQEKDFGRYMLIIRNGIGEPYMQEYNIYPQDSPISESMSVVIGGGVGGAVFVIMVLIVVIVTVVLIRRRENVASQKSSTEREAASAREYDPINVNENDNIEEGVNTEPNDNSYSGLTHYGNLESTYEQLESTREHIVETNVDSTADAIGDNAVDTEEHIDDSYVNI